MARNSQNLFKFELDITTGGALTDYTASVMSISGGGWTLNTGKSNSLAGGEASLSSGGSQYADLTITGFRTETSGSLWRVLSTWYAAVKGGTHTSRTYRLSMPDSSTSGSQQRSGECLISAFDDGGGTGGGGDAATFTATLSIDGSVTDTTVT